MERYAGYIFGGGVAAVAGLWLLRLFDTGSALWLGGMVLALAGLAGLIAGLAIPVDWR